MQLCNLPNFIFWEIWYYGYYSFLFWRKFLAYNFSGRCFLNVADAFLDFLKQGEQKIYMLPYCNF
jgi:hypothetical protein